MLTKHARDALAYAVLLFTGGYRPRPIALSQNGCCRSGFAASRSLRGPLFHGANSKREDRNVKRSNGERSRLQTLSRCIRIVVRTTIGGVSEGARADASGQVVGEEHLTISLRIRPGKSGAGDVERPAMRRDCARTDDPGNCRWTEPAHRSNALRRAIPQDVQVAFRDRQSGIDLQASQQSGGPCSADLPMPPEFGRLGQSVEPPILAGNGAWG